MRTRPNVRDTEVLTRPRRRRPAFFPSLAAIVGIVVFVAAGNWQSGRMEKKVRLGEQLAAAAAIAPVQLPVGADWPGWRYRRVIASGTFDRRHQVLLDNKVYRGRVGYDVVTPLALTDGRVVLVNRGWVAAGASRKDLPAVVAPAGMVSVEGRVNEPPAFLELSREAPVGPVWQNLDLQRFTELTGLPVLPVIMEQTKPVTSDDALVRNWTAPDLGVDKHRIYMFQWYAFAALAGGLWLYFTLRPAR